MAMNMFSPQEIYIPTPWVRANENERLCSVAWCSRNHMCWQCIARYPKIKPPSVLSTTFEELSNVLGFGHSGRPKIEDALESAETPKYSLTVTMESYNLAVKFCYQKGSKLWPATYGRRWPSWPAESELLFRFVALFLTIKVYRRKTDLEMNETEGMNKEPILITSPLAPSGTTEKASNIDSIQSALNSNLPRPVPKSPVPHAGRQVPTPPQQDKVTSIERPKRDLSDGNISRNNFKSQTSGSSSIPAHPADRGTPQMCFPRNIEGDLTRSLDLYLNCRLPSTNPAVSSPLHPRSSSSSSSHTLEGELVPKISSRPLLSPLLSPRLQALVAQKPSQSNDNNTIIMSMDTESIEGESVIDNTDSAITRFTPIKEAPTLAQPSSSPSNAMALQVPSLSPAVTTSIKFPSGREALLPRKGPIQQDPPSEIIEEDRLSPPSIQQVMLSGEHSQPCVPRSSQCDGERPCEVNQGEPRREAKRQRIEALPNPVTGMVTRRGFNADACTHSNDKITILVGPKESSFRVSKDFLSELLVAEKLAMVSQNGRERVYKLPDINDKAFEYLLWCIHKGLNPPKIPTSYVLSQAWELAENLKRGNLKGILLDAMTIRYSGPYALPCVCLIKLVWEDGSHFRSMLLEWMLDYMRCRKYSWLINALPLEILNAVCMSIAALPPLRPHPNRAKVRPLSAKRKRSKSHRDMAKRNPDFRRTLLDKMLSGSNIWNRIMSPFMEPIGDNPNHSMYGMNFSIMKSKMDMGKYTDAKEFEVDVRQTFQNCYRHWFNDHAELRLCKAFEAAFDKSWTTETEGSQEPDA